MASETRTVDNVFNGNTCRLESSTNTSEGSSQWAQLKTSFTYDTYGNIKTTTLDSANLGAPDRTTEFFYDTVGHVGHLPSSMKRYIAGEYDHTELLTWDYRFTSPLSHTNPNGQTRSFQYDEFGRIQREDRPDGSYTNWARGFCHGCSDALYFDYELPSNGLSRATFFDTYGRAVGTNRAGLAVSEWLWLDHLGRIDEQVLPRRQNGPSYSVLYDYDYANRVTQANAPVDESQPAGLITTYAYDRFKTTVTSPGNPSSQVTQYFRDALGRTTSVIDAGNGVSQYTYSSFDQLKSARDPGGHTTTLVYNNRGDKMSMTDPDLGFWQYGYNVFGELTWQKDAKGQVVVHNYDQLGRVDWRSEPEFPGANPDPNYWQDDARTDFAYYNTGDHRHGLLAYELAPDGFERDYQYDSLGRLSEEKTVIDGANYFTNFAYATAGTAKGALERITYPTSTSGVRFKVDYEYGTAGLLSKVKDGDNPSTVFYQLTSYDGLFRETQATLGNGVVETRVFDRANLLLESIQSGASIQSLAYDWYPSGGLKQRIDTIAGKTDDFTYDALNRLETHRINSSLVLDMDFTSSGDGNIQFKTGVGTYGYGGTSGGPHAVTSITGLQSNAYAYDANGNMTNRDGDAITWYSHNLPKRINYGTDSAEFWYGTDRSRYKQVAVEGGSTATTRYVGNHFEVETRGGLTSYRHFIRAGDRVVAQLERRSDGSNPIRYLHRDHLGSVVATTDGGGVLQQRFEFEPYGTRWRTAGSGADDTERGFTGHEHLDAVELIHMNGRVQDPELGLFISADPFVQAPYHAPSLNRYSYVWNNPVALVDPTGFEMWCMDLENPVCMNFAMVATDSVNFSGGFTLGGENNLALVASQGGSDSDGARVIPNVNGAPTTRSLPEIVPRPVMPSRFAGLSYSERTARNLQNLNSNLLRQEALRGLLFHEDEEVRHAALHELVQTNIGFAMGATGGINRVWKNLLPGRLSGELALAARVGAGPIRAGTPAFATAVNSGTIKWVVTESGELLITPAYVGGVQVSHAVLSGGKGVLAAGEADVAFAGGRYFGIQITNWSGHFRPSTESLAIGRAAFERSGIIFPQ